MKASENRAPQKRVAKLVCVSFVTRVIVDENATLDEIMNEARPKLINKVLNELSENLEDVIEDKEVPYNTKFDKI